MENKAGTKRIRKEKPKNIAENNIVMQLFQEYARQLDDKHDRYERIVKISRDITIESKRIIFLLHNRNTDIESKRAQILNEAKQRLNQLINKQFRSIALELEGHDPYLYLRAYSFGLQEFTEALLFLQYLQEGEIQNWKVVDDMFSYKINSDETPESDSSDDNMKEIYLCYPQSEFILGLADFTGELMRKCINKVGAGMFEDCFKICQYNRYILTGFLGIGKSGQKEITRKLYTLTQSVAKMELVCYNIKVRGSEIPKHMLAIVEPMNITDNFEDDEGYF